MISLIAAVDGNFLIGNGERLPWHYPQDLAFFKEKVANQTILVGLRTYRSLCSYYKNKKFPFKSIYLATTASDISVQYYRDDISIRQVNDVTIFLHNFHKTSKSIFVIGGRQIYQLALPYVNILYLTYILRRFSGNIYFPYLNLYKYILKEYRIIEELIFATYYKK
ncbi:MAG: dihydrofolate reductase [Pigeon pea little leaf phytoplasma]|uniref:dihydrofolate reductase n=1 Tax=Candidatus Phytoplasma fabacearum TaxID=2982628 RepID=A0ABU8ZSF0_9MOLU|nr:dihydrofolate reductase ['Bituminaria bituminosa' little leaf phytoplasma]MDV3148847.1 dihydrofolate reductase [Pigeon pea little leaf phytoplasma]MDO7983628.1 dihydrofolate reductase ['Bituminaria bituminosa' little leaf phytoplasma]MDO8023927.1 dihydrofolate reductase ['Bituminaria bituminosa' little leaf phytoplasma]MDO8030479.1 dihydrofolate reductase ['Bituminaria bituminosa' little leaf phytoplasma]MDV3154081.1 dihydrofolate reductase [Pigeon pea little leaf phytoplasma]